MIGGIKRAGFKDKRVLVKPDVNSDDPYPATTNPEVVRSVGQINKIFMGLGSKLAPWISLPRNGWLLLMPTANTLG